MTLDDFLKLISIVYLFLGGVLTAIFAYSQVRNKNSAEAINSLTKSVLDLNKEISDLKQEYDARLDEKEKEIARLRTRVMELEQGKYGKSGRQMGQ
jgi:cell division protein FtsB